MNINFDLTQIGTFPQQLDGTTLRLDAVRFFNQAVTRGRWNTFLAKLLHKDNRLHCLDAHPVVSHHLTSRIVTVPIRQIKGTLGRVDDFDSSFNPLHERSRTRWVSILTAILSDISLPPIELVQVGDAYFVQDGHHRLSVAHALGQEAIEARIVN
jgi:uncharacterized ParB-like nuclease family protein